MPFLLLALLVVPLVELYVIIQVGQAIGAGWTIILLLADSVLGAVIVRSQGRLAWRRFVEAMHTGRMPAREVLDGALIIVGGAFLLTPGFVTDAIGFALLVPPSRALVRELVVRRFAVQLTAAVRRGPVFGARGGRPGGPPGPGPAFDVEGTAHEPHEPAEGGDGPPALDHDAR